MSETGDGHLPHLITNVHTTPATTQDAASTDDIQAALYEKGLLPSRYLVDARYIDGDLLAQSGDKYGIELFGPTRRSSSWQSREGGIDAAQFEVDWNNRQTICPAGKSSVGWLECQLKERNPRSVVKVKFRRKDCFNCPNPDQYVRSQTGAPRQLLLQQGVSRSRKENTGFIFERCRTARIQRASRNRRNPFARYQARNSSV